MATKTDIIEFVVELWYNKNTFSVEDEEKHHTKRKGGWQMIEFERTTITMKLPFHKKISFGGSQTTEGALDFFRKLRSKDEYHMQEISCVIRALEKAKRFGCERLTFWIQNNQMHITFEFEKVLDASLFIKLIS